MALGIIPTGQDFQVRDMQAGALYMLLGQYVATITQAGTAAPVESVLAVNTVGTVALARSSAGVYTLTTDGIWLDGTNIQVSGTGTAVDFKVVRTSANVITISTFAADGSTATDLAGTLYVNVAVYGV